jgi:hypothetical protein
MKYTKANKIFMVNNNAKTDMQEISTEKQFDKNYLYDYVYKLITEDNRNRDEVLRILMQMGIEDKDASDIYYSVFTKIENSEAIDKKSIEEKKKLRSNANKDLLYGLLSLVAGCCWFFLIISGNDDENNEVGGYRLDLILISFGLYNLIKGLIFRFLTYKTKSNQIIGKRLEQQKDEIDFKSIKTQSWLYTIGILAFSLWLILGYFSNAAIWICSAIWICYLILVFCCTKWYNKTFATILKWLAALFFAFLVLGIIRIIILGILQIFERN